MLIPLWWLGVATDLQGGYDEAAYRESARVLLYDAFPLAVPGFRVSPATHLRLELPLLQELVRATLRVAANNGAKLDGRG